MTIEYPPRDVRETVAKFLDGWGKEQQSAEHALRQGGNTSGAGQAREDGRAAARIAAVLRSPEAKPQRGQGA